MVFPSSIACVVRLLWSEADVDVFCIMSRSNFRNCVLLALINAVPFSPYDIIGAMDIGHVKYFFLRGSVKDWFSSEMI
jgi:hypothetical protein